MLTENQTKVLHMVASNVDMSRMARNLSADAAVERFNLHAPVLLRMGLIDYAPRRRVAYELTAAGKEALR